MNLMVVFCVSVAFNCFSYNLFYFIYHILSVEMKFFMIFSLNNGNSKLEVVRYKMF